MDTELATPAVMMAKHAPSWDLVRGRCAHDANFTFAVRVSHLLGVLKCFERWQTIGYFRPVQL